MNAKSTAAALALLLTTAGAAVAGAVTPIRYHMLNGNTGTYNYWDETYSGAGCVTCDGSQLTDGRGDLTDGIIATDNWFVVEAPAGNGPYVGWNVTPTISFHFGGVVNIGSVTFYLDDSDGNGGVRAPLSIIINGTEFAVPEPAGSAPFSFTANIDFSGSDLSVTLNRKDDWVFLSEVTFEEGNSSSVPEPGSALLALAALGALATARKRRQA